MARASRAANRSLERLKDREWVEVVPVFAFPDGKHLRVIELNALTPAGVNVVAALYDQDPLTAGITPASTGAVDPAPETILHEVAVRDALIFLIRLMQHHSIPIQWWTLDARALIATGKTALELAPDIIMVIGDEAIPLLVEVDLGTESIDSGAANAWRTKFGNYEKYLNDDAGRDVLFDGCGTPLVVVIGVTGRRLHNLQTSLRKWGGERRWQFALLDDLSPVNYGALPLVGDSESPPPSNEFIAAICLRAGLWAGR